MRVFTFVSKQGDGLPVAMRVAQEGHRVQFYINDEKSRKVGEGLVDKHREEGILISKSGRINTRVLSQVLHPRPDCVIMDMVGGGFGNAASRIRSMGIPVIGGHEWGDMVELDRPYGHKVMQTTGIKTPTTYVFTDYKKAIAFVQESRKPYVYKPSGNQPTTTTYVAQGAEDLIGMLEYYSDIKEEFELQEKVDGVEVSTEGWFNGSKIIGVNHTMEEKSLMPGGLGPKAGCMGSVVWIGSDQSRLFKETVGRLIPLLKRVKYVGPIDVNCIVSKDAAFGLEFTARFGYDALFVLLEMYKGRINDLMYGVASGVLKTMNFKSNLGIGVDLAVPPYPLADIEPDMYEGILIQGLNKYNLKHFWAYDVCKKKDKYVTSGNGGDIGTVTARGDEIQGFSPLRDAKRRVMRTISNLIIPDVMYREDIGNRVEADRAQLKNWGWL